MTGSVPAEGAPITANSVLPADRRQVPLVTADGLRLVAEAALPLAQDGEPAATIICAHPLPTHGGSMDSHIFRKAAWRLPALADIAVVRFNTRGTASAIGRSEGSFDHADGEGLDLSAAVEWAQGAELPNIWLVGWSFGTDVILRHGRLDGVRGAVLLSPPLRFCTAADLAAWDADGRPITALVPEFDDYLPPDAAARSFAGVRQLRIVPASGAQHLWVGERWVRWVLDSIVGVVAPQVSVPLPRTWSGPMGHWDDLRGGLGGGMED